MAFLAYGHFANQSHLTKFGTMTFCVNCAVLSCPNWANGPRPLPAPFESLKTQIWAIAGDSGGESNHPNLNPQTESEGYVKFTQLPYMGGGAKRMAKFTRGHFKRIAAMLLNVKPMRMNESEGEKLYHAGRQRQWIITVDWFASEFRILNPNFDVDKFKGACGL